MIKIFLLLTIITPPGEPDRERKFEAPSLEECWSKARDFLRRDPKDFGGIGLGAGCYSVMPPGDPT